MISIARDLDHLQKHIDWYGSIVPKTPDAWSEARLTTHRQEFEKEMAKELGNFTEKISGSTVRQDQIFFAQAFTLNAAISGRGATRTTTTGSTTNSFNLNNSRSDEIKTDIAKGGSYDASATSSTDTVTKKDPTTTEKNSSTTKDNNSETTTGTAKSTSGSSNAIADSQTTARTALDAPAAVSAQSIVTNDPKFADFSKGSVTVSLEPSEYLAQKNRYLNFLNQLRRNGEGDDTADSPGYQLTLVRVPVSILPGKKTDSGYGAEITMTLNSEPGREFLPWMFRKVVINDVIESLGYPLMKSLEEKDVWKFLDKTNYKDLMCGNVRDFLPNRDICEVPVPKVPGEKSNNLVPDTARFLKASDLSTSGEVPKKLKFSTTVSGADQGLNHFASIKLPAVQPTRGVFFRSAMPNSQLIDVYGLRFAFLLAYGAAEAVRSDPNTDNYIHLPDIQSYIQEEASGAYRLLLEPNNQDIWTSFCTQTLVSAIRQRDVVTLEQMRNQFRIRLNGNAPNGVETNQPAQTFTAAFAWAIIVDAALLNDRLIQDMRETGAARNVSLDCGWLDYYSPNPSETARQNFNAYIQTRWPVRVFALDPDVEEQNLQDSLTTRRETQLALSLAFVSGRMNASSFTRWARRLDAQYDTIALNRTQVGFSHGDNTFGWRFYPRFQTPDTDSNLGATIKDNFIGGPNRDSLLNQRRLEPGPRECVALVMMPAFIPYLTLDTTANWFQLSDPKHKTLDHTDALRLSRVVKTLQVGCGGVKDADAYRAVDQRLLRNRVEQLSARLPMQSATIQVPMRNTVAGHALFNNGVTDLAPELTGFYGAPGLPKETDGATIFLVGDHFSVNRTEIIVGNKKAKFVKLLSRQVAQVTLEGNLTPTEDGYYRAHVATPYGVSREIEIPLIVPAEKPAEPAKPTEGFTLAPTAIEATYTAFADGKGNFTTLGVTATKPTSLKITPSDALGNAPPAIQIMGVVILDEASQPVVFPLANKLQISLLDGAYAFSKDQVTLLANELLNEINKKYPTHKVDGSVLNKPIILQSLKVQPLDAALNPIGVPVSATNSLQVTFLAAWTVVTK